MRGNVKLFQPEQFVRIHHNSRSVKCTFPFKDVISVVRYLHLQRVYSRNHGNEDEFNRAETLLRNKGCLDERVVDISQNPQCV